MKQKLLHIMMGTHNPDLQKGLDSVFQCLHYDWTAHGINSYPLQSELLTVFHHFQPDIVFMHLQSGEVLNIETIKKMSESSKVLNWTGDVRHPLQSFYMEIGRYIDSTLFTNVDDIDTCKQNGVEADYLQVGFDSNHFNPLGKFDEKNSKYPEIIFMGSNYGEDAFPLSSLRYQMAHRLKQEFGNRFGVYGNGWSGLESGNITSYEEEGLAYRSCKIAINLSHFAYKRYSSDRMYRILGSGALCLSHHYPDIEMDFEIGKDLVVWENIDDLVSKIKKYLLCESDRGIIALNGCLKARTKFTWHHFAENLKELSDKIKTKKTQEIIN